MSQKTTPEKNDKRRIDPRKLNLDDESCSSNAQDSRKIKPGKRKTYKPNNSTTVAIVNPTMGRPMRSIRRTFPTVYSLPYTPYSSAMPICTPMAPYAPPIITGYPYTDARWNTIVTSVHNPIYPIPVPQMPMNALPVPIYNAQVCPYSSLIGPPIIASDPTMHMLSPMAASVAPADYSFSQGFESAFYEPIPTTVVDTSYTNVVDKISQKLQTSPVRSREEFKPLDFDSYFLLPKDLFQPARMIKFDPNYLIDQFCQLSDCSKILPWILDLEFGVPRQPVTRPIATYDAQYNSIHCKNTPGAIHPGFERCSQEFKGIFLFYYDLIISSWYRGFVVLNSDRSVENFQTWLQVPLQSIGMCWP